MSEFHGLQLTMHPQRRAWAAGGLGRGDEMQVQKIDANLYYTLGALRPGAGRHPSPRLHVLRNGRLFLPRGYQR